MNPDAHYPIPLVCISIHAPTANGLGTIPSQEEAVQARDEFFTAAVKGMPTLRYIAYAESQPRGYFFEYVLNEEEIDDESEDHVPWRWWRIVRGRGRKPGSDSEGESENPEDDEEDDERGDADGTDEVVEVRQIPTWEGERVRAFLKSVNLETAEAFDGKCSLWRQSLSCLLTLLILNRKF